jgi:serine O-acetyltransferase
MSDNGQTNLPPEGERARADGIGALPVSDALVKRVVDSIHREPLIAHLGGTRLPSREAIEELVELMRELMFPGFFCRRGLTANNLPLHVQELLTRAAIRVEEQVRSTLRYIRDIGLESADCPESIECDRMARRITAEFLDQLPHLRTLLSTDVQAAFDGDPAAHHHDETIFCYPGIEAMFSHRVAHALLMLGVPLLPRLIQEIAHTQTGIDIHPGAHIGRACFIDHGGGVVIGETSVIGEHARIYQNVTLGAKSFDKDEKGRLVRTGKKRHPTIGNRVTIYAGAVILGGDTHIGDDCVISGSVFVTQSVPPGHVVRQKQPELVLRSNKEASYLGGDLAKDEIPGGG